MTVQNNLGKLSQMTGLSQAELAKRAEQLVDAKTGKISALSALDAALVEALGTGAAPTMQSFTAQGSATANPHAIDEPLQAYTHAQPMAGFAPEAAAPPSIGGPAALLERAGKAGAQRIHGFCGACQPPAPPPPEPVAPEAPKPPPVASPENGGSGGDVVVSSDIPLPSTPVAPPPAATISSAPAPSTARTGSIASAPARTGRPTATATSAATTTAKRGFDNVGDAAIQGDLDVGSMNLQFELIKQQMQKMSQMQALISNTMSAMHEQGMTAIRNVKA